MGGYNSVTNAADAEDLRRALNYQGVNYYGTSYGTRLAHTLIRYYPENIRSVILDTVFPPQVAYPNEAIVSFSGAHERVFQRCADDEVCRDKYPNLEETFYHVVEDLREILVRSAPPVGKWWLMKGFSWMPFTCFCTQRKRLPGCCTPSTQPAAAALDRSRGLSTACRAITATFRPVLTYHRYAGMRSALILSRTRWLLRKITHPRLVDHLVSPYTFELRELWLSDVS